MIFNLKKVTVTDIGLIKLAVLSGAFFLISVWPGLASWVTGTHWAWFLGAMVIFAILPAKKVFS
jgi:hypothetical protein